MINKWWPRPAWRFVHARACRPRRGMRERAGANATATVSGRRPRGASPASHLPTGEDYCWSVLVDSWRMCIPANRPEGRRVSASHVTNNIPQGRRGPRSKFPPTFPGSWQIRTLLPLFSLIVVYHLTRVIHIRNKAEENLGQTLSPKSSVSVTESTIGIAALSEGFLLLRQTLSSIPLTVSICPELTSAMPRKWDPVHSDRPPAAGA